jgi:hypothetical protein
MSDVELVRDPDDPVEGAVPVARAAERLRHVLAGRGIRADEVPLAEDPATGRLTVRLAGPAAPGSPEAPSPAASLLPATPEAFAVVARDRLVEARGADARGLAYATRELADRVEHEDDPITALRPEQPLVERPANPVRSVMRLFCSRVEDLGWFRDDSWWRDYLSMLIAQRFNRVNLALGLGYNYHRGITDAYLYFPYPFLLQVPGFGTRVPQLPEEERERNLAALRSASDEAEAVGLEFQLGLWTHGYRWIDSPHADQTIEGLRPEDHAAYSRDALGELLDHCPAISGLTFRIHGESGVPERSWDFWGTVFEAVRDAGRRVRLDLHAKGLDRPTLDAALETGQPVTVSPKFWAEHMGLPYHQAAIRELERPARQDPSHRSEWHRHMAVSEGSRPFTRYGYGDFLSEDRPYDLVFRLWAGTQRLLLWGDPAFATAYGRASGLAGARGLEWCEPLTFKGREGSGISGSRTGYADERLAPDRDWEKYAYAYRLFGRFGYDPDAGPEPGRRWLRSAFGDDADDAEAALAAASRILPLVTTVHHPSASNNYYWPELYTDMPIVWSGEETRPHPYLDTPTPRRFGTVSPLDPEVFSSVAGFVEELLDGTSSGRWSPLRAADRLDALAAEADDHLARIRSRTSRGGPELDRWVVDAAIQAELGRFFAGKLRAAVHYELHRATGSGAALAAAVTAYRAARRAWGAAAAAATGVYVPDLTFGADPRLRGHWSDRLAAIDADLHDMEGRISNPTGADPGDDDPFARLLVSAERPAPAVEIVHEPPDAYRVGVDLPVEVQLRGPDVAAVERVTLRYRPMNQALAWKSIALSGAVPRFSASIPGGGLDGRHPLAYAFVLETGDGRARRSPGLEPDLTSTPYLVLLPEGSRSAPDPPRAP